MKVNRENFISILEAISPGLATNKRELVEQSTCFVFAQDRVWTYNDEISCSIPCTFGLSGAIKAEPLLNLLSRLTEEFVDVEPGEDQIIVKGKRKKSGLTLEQDVLLPIDAIEKPDKWSQLEAGFADAIRQTVPCASSDENMWVLTCVHVTPNYIEACDRFQIARCGIETGIEEEFLVRADAIKGIVNLGLTRISETESWIHFTNSSELIVSVKKYNQAYSDVSQYMSFDGTEPIEFPGGLSEIVQKAEIFSARNAEGNNVTVDLKADRLVIEGRGVDGWYKQMEKVKYAGKPVRFDIPPKLLVRVSEGTHSCRIASDRVMIDGGNFVYSTSTFQAK